MFKTHLIIFASNCNFV